MINWIVFWIAAIASVVAVVVVLWIIDEIYMRRRL
jgi:hypothetical protein